MLLLHVWVPALGLPGAEGVLRLGPAAKHLPSATPEPATLLTRAARATSLPPPSLLQRGSVLLTWPVMLLLLVSNPHNHPETWLWLVVVLLSLTNCRHEQWCLLQWALYAFPSERSLGLGLSVL